jgi:hypothetical protein
MKYLNELNTGGSTKHSRVKKKKFNLGSIFCRKSYLNKLQKNKVKMRVWLEDLPLFLLAAYVPLSVIYSFSALQAVLFLMGLFILRTQVGG